MQPARADPVGATLVFLNLLEGQADGLPQPFLAQTEHVPTEPNSGTDMDIDRVRLVALPTTRPSDQLLRRHSDRLPRQQDPL